MRSQFVTACSPIEDGSTHATMDARKAKGSVMSGEALAKTDYGKWKTAGCPFSQGWGSGGKGYLFIFSRSDPASMAGSS